MLLVLAQTEPAPAGWERGADFAVKHAEQRPDIFFPLLASVGFLAIIVGAGWLFVKYALPAWRDEKKLDREHLTALVVQRGKEAMEDVAAFRELAKAQQAAIVERVGDAVSRQTGELQKLVDRSERHTDLLTRIAGKVGVGLLIVTLAAGVVLAARRTVIANNECPKGCASGYHCCSRDGLCCPNDKTTAVKPQSSLYADCAHNYREVYSACE